MTDLYLIPAHLVRKLCNKIHELHEARDNVDDDELLVNLKLICTDHKTPSFRDISTQSVADLVFQVIKTNGLLIATIELGGGNEKWHIPKDSTRLQNLKDEGTVIIDEYWPYILCNRSSKVDASKFVYNSFQELQRCIDIVIQSKSKEII